MFEIGKSYTFHIEDYDGFGTSTLKVVAWEAPLVQLRRAGVELFVLNTNSSRFLKAEQSDHDADAVMVVRTSSSGGVTSIKFE